MTTSVEHNTLLWPLLLYAAAVLVVVGAMLGLSYVIGERHKEPETDESYEAGIVSTGSARLRFSAHFYIVAMFFVIFDLEAAIIVAWAVAFRQLGWAGYIGVAVFIGILVAVLLYEWKIGALDFGPKGKKILKAQSEFVQRERREKV